MSGTTHDALTPEETPKVTEGLSIRCIDCRSGESGKTNDCEMCFILQTLATEIDIPPKANPSYRRAKWYLQTEGKLQTRANFLRTLASKDVVPRFAVGMKAVPNFIPRTDAFVAKYYDHLRQQGKD